MPRIKPLRWQITQRKQEQLVSDLETVSLHPCDVMLNTVSKTPTSLHIPCRQPYRLRVLDILLVPSGILRIPFPPKLIHTFSQINIKLTKSTCNIFLSAKQQHFIFYSIWHWFSFIYNHMFPCALIYDTLIFMLLYLNFIANILC